MGRAVTLVLLALIAFMLALAGQAFGFYDVPALRGVLDRVPFGVSEPAPEPTAEPAPSPSVAAKPSPVPSPPPAAADGGCTAATLRFVYGAATLKAALGDRMGEPQECERVVDAAGNTEQRTTTGLAYYRAGSNVAVFTNGVEHWALTANGVVHWTSGDVEPPADAEPFA
jgi:hypothetical protein